MLAELLFLQGQYEPALLHFSDLIEADPLNCEARSRFIQCLRRSGKSSEIAQHLLAAEQTIPRAATNPGFLYCRCEPGSPLRRTLRLYCTTAVFSSP